MHNRPFKKDEVATKAARFRSKYSYISRRMHPDSNPPHQCEYLAGLDDIGVRRCLVFSRDKFRCVDCGGTEQFDDPLEMAHGGNTKISRCDCMENLKTKHHSCHGINDHSGRFGVRRGESQEASQ